MKAKILITVGKLPKKLRVPKNGRHIHLDDSSQLMQVLDDEIFSKEDPPILDLRINGKKRKLPDYAPQELQIFADARCNANCSFCGAADMASEQNVPLKYILHLIDDAKKKNYLLINLMGREPFFDLVRFRKIVEPCNKLGIDVASASNGLFAKDLQTAEHALKGVKAMVFSIDEAHFDNPNFQKEEIVRRMANAIEAALQKCQLIQINDTRYTDSKNDEALKPVFAVMNELKTRGYEIRVNLDKDDRSFILRKGVRKFKIIYAVRPAWKTGKARKNANAIQLKGNDCRNVAFGIEECITFSPLGIYPCITLSHLKIGRILSMNQIKKIWTKDRNVLEVAENKVNKSLFFKSMRKGKCIVGSPLHKFIGSLQHRKRKLK